MPVVVVRHALVLVLAFGSVLAQLAVQQLTVSVSLAILLGAVAALLARGLMGAVFLAGGMLAGFFVVVAYQNTTPADAGTAVGHDGWLYALLIAVALATYFVVRLVIGRLRRS